MKLIVNGVRSLLLACQDLCYLTKYKDLTPQQVRLPKRAQEEDKDEQSYGADNAGDQAKNPRCRIDLPPKNCTTLNERIL